VREERRTLSSTEKSVNERAMRKGLASPFLSGGGEKRRVRSRHYRHYTLERKKDDKESSSEEDQQDLQNKEEFCTDGINKESTSRPLRVLANGRDVQKKSRGAIWVENFKNIGCWGVKRNAVYLFEFLVNGKGGRRL